MYRPKNKISNLIFHQLKGDLNEIQNQELQAWLGESRHQKLFERIISKKRILQEK